MALKTLADKPKNTIFATAYVAEVKPSRVSSSGTNMVTEFQLFLNGPAHGEAQNGTRAYLTWNPTWFRPSFDICALSAEVDRLNVRIDQGDQEAAEAKALINSTLWTAKMNIFDDPSENAPTIRGLIGGRTYEEHDALWEQFCARVQELGAANPGSDEDEAVDAAAQDAIVKGVDEFFQEFFGPESIAGKFIALTYGHKKDGKDENGQPVYSKYRNVLRYIIPGQKTDMSKRLESWKKSCAKPKLEGLQTVFLVDENEPFGSTPF